MSMPACPPPQVLRRHHPVRCHLRSCILTCLTVFGLPLQAHAEAAPTYDRVSLNASAQAQVENNLMRVVFYAQSEQKNASAAASTVNATMQKADALLRDDDKLHHQTLDYTTQPVYDDRTIVAWQVRQSLLVESENMAHLADRMGPLQNLLDVQSVSFDVTDNERRLREDELIRQALDNFRARAELISNQLGASGYRIVQVTVDGQGQVYAPPRAMKAYAMSAAESAEPAVEAGRQTLAVQASGEIELLR